MTLLYMCPGCAKLVSPPLDHDPTEALMCRKCGVSMTPSVTPILSWLEVDTDTHVEAHENQVA